MNTEILLGRTPDREIVTVEIRLQPAQLQATGRTVKHRPIPAGSLELAIMGAVYVTRFGRTDIVGGGQCIDAARRVQPSEQWTQADLDRLVGIWKRWHLNGLRAGCAHQEVVWEDSPLGRRPSLELTQPCPETGYRYGSAWLYEPLPEDVVADVRRFQRRLGMPGYVR